MKFETVEEIQDRGRMKESLARLKRLTRPAQYLFKARCEAIEGAPLLLLAPAGSKVSRALAEEVRAGSRPVWGQVRRRGRGLIFTTEGPAKRKEMTRLIAKAGRNSGVSLPKARISVCTRAESRAIDAMDRSIRIVRRVRRPTRFFFKSRCEALNNSPMLLLDVGTAARHVGALRAGSPTIEGTVEREGRQLIFTVTRGAISPSVMARQLVALAREARVSIGRPVVRIGEGGADAPAAEAPAAGTPRRRARRAASGRPLAGADAPAVTAAAPGTVARETATREAAARETATREAAARETVARETVAREAATREAAAREAKRARAEAARQAAKEAARAAAARQAAEAAAQAAAARQAAEAAARAERQRREAERQAAELQRKRASLAPLKKRHARALADAEEAAEELAAAEAAMLREQAVRKALKAIDDLDDFREALIALQEQITAETGKQDKDLRSLQRDLQGVDDVEDALDEVEEWFAERKEELEEELDELREEAEETAAKAAKIGADVAAIEALG